MKKIIYIASLLLASAFSSCDDFLTVESPDKQTGNNFWATYKDVDGALATCYSQLEHFGDGWQFPEVKFPVEAYREDIVTPGADAYNYQDWMELFNFTYTQGNSQLSPYFAAPYRGINYCNQVIEGLDKVSDKEFTSISKKQIMAEVKFLRGFYHMKLLMNWEKIYIRDKYAKSEKELGGPVSERPVTWEFIIKDLSDAAKDLPEKQPTANMGRATSGAAYSYLGMAYLTRAYEEPAQKADYMDKCVKALDKVTGYSLEKNFLSMFDGTNKNSQESILEYQLVKNDQVWYTAPHSKWLQVYQLGKGYEEILPSKMLLEEFKEEGKIAKDGNYDNRLYQTLFFQDSYFNDVTTPRVYGKIFDKVFVLKDKAGNITKVLNDKIAFRKYIPASWELLSKTWGDINTMLMRYGNVILMKAEALNELGRTPEAITLINSIRDIHGNMPPMTKTSYDDVKAQIEHERMIEFPLENSRFFDLRRWGKTQSAMKVAGRNFDPKTSNFYPIPQRETTSNSKM